MRRLSHGSWASRAMVRVHPARARLASKLPAGLRTLLRAIAQRGTRALSHQTDEWGRPRRLPPIDDWSTKLVGTGPGVGSFRQPLPVVRVESDGPATASASSQGGPALRCLFVTTVFDVGGAGEVVAFLATRLREHGIVPAVLNTVAAPKFGGVPQGRLGKRLLTEGIEVVELDQASAVGWVERWQPDVINAHGAPPWVLQHATKIDVPYVDTLHGMHDFFGADWTAESKRARNVAMIIAVSDLVRRQYTAGNPGYPAERLISIPNAVDDRRILPVDRDVMRSSLGLSTEYLFVCLARHSLQKNSYGLVAAFDEVSRRHADAHLVITGRVDDDGYFRHVKRLRDSLPGRDRIHLRDHFAQPGSLLAAADGFVLDSFFEGWSLASMEALFAGLPVVLSEVGGAREQVEGDAWRGFVVDNPLGDPLDVSWAKIGPARFARQLNRQQVVDAMSRLIVDRQDYAERRAEIASESARRFAAAACVGRHAAALQQVARSQAGPADRQELR
jgi:glycosyltransferase involved in cell wall biosynthesis